METETKTIATKIAETEKQLRDLHYAAFLERKKSETPTQIRSAKEIRDERYRTDNGLSVHKLRQAGNTVKISHIRYTQLDNVPVLVPVPSYLRKFTEFWPRGGATYLTIVTPEKESFTSVSICHEVDCFDYRLGVKLALDAFSKETAEKMLSPLEATNEDVPVLPDTVETPAEGVGIEEVAAV